MTVSQALDAVAAYYVPGVVKHYSAMKPDPWQNAHDDLERNMLIGDYDFGAAGAEKFVSECKRLIDAFKALNLPKRFPPIEAGFVSGDEEQCRKWQSRRHKICYKCGGKNALQLIPDPTDDRNAVVVCQSCKVSRSA